MIDLTTKLPESVNICAKEYPINTDFRVWISFEKMFRDDNEDAQTVFINAIKMCFKRDSNGILTLPPTWQDTLKGLFDFYRAGEGMEKNEDKNNDAADEEADEEKPRKEKRIYDWDIDGKYIFAAFMSQYNINLLTDKLHWWAFRALFDGLGKEEKICEIMSIRAMRLSDIKDKDLKKHYAKLKRIYALPDMRTEQEKENDLGNMLW